MEIKNERLSLRITEDEKKLIRKRAIDKDIKISEYIMYLVDKDIKQKFQYNNFNFEFKRLESSVKCVHGMLEKFENYEVPCNRVIPVVLPSVKELMQELEELKERLEENNLID